MCPMCIATTTMTWIAAGAVSTGAVAALAIRGISGKKKTLAPMTGQSPAGAKAV